MSQSSSVNSGRYHDAIAYRSFGCVLILWFANRAVVFCRSIDIFDTSSSFLWNDPNPKLRGCFKTNLPLDGAMETESEVDLYEASPRGPVVQHGRCYFSVFWLLNVWKTTTQLFQSILYLDILSACFNLHNGTANLYNVIQSFLFFTANALLSNIIDLLGRYMIIFFSRCCFFVRGFMSVAS